MLRRTSKPWNALTLPLHFLCLLAKTGQHLIAIWRYFLGYHNLFSLSHFCSIGHSFILQFYSKDVMSNMPMRYKMWMKYIYKIPRARTWCLINGINPKSLIIPIHYIFVFAVWISIGGIYKVATSIPPPPQGLDD